MKRILLPVLFSGLLLNGAFAQSINDIPSVAIESPNMDVINADDEAKAKQGGMYRIAVNLPANIDFYNEGLWYNDEDGNIVGQINIKSEGARAINLIFDEYTLPVGAELRVFSPTTGQLVGPYTADQDPEGGLMMTSMVHGEELVLEVVIPEEAIGDFKLHLKDIGYYYRSTELFGGMDTRDFGESESCEVNVACSEGSTSANQIAGVCRIVVTDGGGQGLCSGTLINNTANDCTPYVLTAQHCGAGATVNEFKVWQFHFKYQSATCANPGAEPTYSSVNGSIKVAASGTISNVQKSDFTLVIMKGRPVASAGAYYNGWNKSSTASTGGGKGIHHPAGDIKKISAFSGTPTSATWWGGTSNAHWQVSWIGTTNGHGVTEPGSSGSPLFNSAGLVIGDLSGGSSFCTPASAQDDPDLYGKFSYGWSSCGTTPQLQIAPWLDRANTGATTLTGVLQTSCATASVPVVDFNASNLYPAVNDLVAIVDASTNSPFAWTWTITPATYTFVGGTTQNSQNPQVQFTATGNYTVNLTAANTGGYGVKNKSAYIHVGGLGLGNEETAKVSMYPNPAKDMLYLNIGTSTWDLAKTTITMMDLTGKYVLVERVNTVNANIISISIPESIATGFYMVQISDGTNMVTDKIEVLK
jgi:lysyl endopeptidase